MLDHIKNLLSVRPPAKLRERLETMIQKSPTPVFWLFGKTQTGKTSVIRFLTGANDAEIGQGFKPCTRYSRVYSFPSEDATALKFLDTRGLDEPGYDPRKDLEQFDDDAHVLIVTARVLDQALANVVKQLRKIREAQPNRAVVLVLTCLHEAYPQQQHILPYPFQWIRAGQGDMVRDTFSAVIPEDLRKAIRSQLQRFEGLYDYAVPIDFTLADEGFNEAYYGGQALKEVLVEALPQVYRQTLIDLEETTGELRDLYARHALPQIISYSSLAALAGGIPIPWLDMITVPAIQTRMITQLAKLYGQQIDSRRFAELASGLGFGVAAGQAAKRITRFIPFVGATIGNAVAWGAATFALGRVCCHYLTAVRRGHVPGVEDLRHLYQEHVRLAETSWRGAKSAMGPA